MKFETYTHNIEGDNQIFFGKDPCTCTRARAVNARARATKRVRARLQLAWACTCTDIYEKKFGYHHPSSEYKFQIS